MLTKVIRCVCGLLIVVNFFASEAVSAQKNTFPYEINSWVIRDIPTGIAYGSALAGLYFVGENLVSRAEDFENTDLISSGEIGFFDRYATRQWSDKWDSFSDQLLWGMGVATAASLAVVLSDQEKVSGSVARSNTATLALMAAELLVINKGFTDLVKGSVRRRRPYVHNQDLTFNQKFQIATDDARVAAGRHFPSDVIVGAIVGSAIGHLVPRSHRLGGDTNIHIINRGYQGIGFGIQIPVS